MLLMANMLEKLRNNDMKRFMRIWFLNHYTWSSIRWLRKWEFQGAWIIISLLPLLFSFLYQAKLQAQQEIVFDIAPHSEIRLSQNDTGLVIGRLSLKYAGHTSKDKREKIYSWELSMQVLFFSALFFLLGRMLHKLCPEEVFVDREYYARQKRIEASGGSAENLDVEKHQAVKYIESYEDIFKEKVATWANLLHDKESVEKLKAIEAGYFAKYDILSTSRLPYLLLTSLSYIISISLLVAIISLRTYLMIRGL